MIVDEEALKQWLIVELDPICEAEPAVLADYVLAMITKDDPVEKLRSYCKKNLSDFLRDHTDTFVDRLFDVVLNDRYQPESSSVVQDEWDRQDQWGDEPLESMQAPRDYSNSQSHRAAAPLSYPDDSEEEESDGEQNYKRRRRKDDDGPSVNSSVGRYPMDRRGHRHDQRGGYSQHFPPRHGLNGGPHAMHAGGRGGHADDEYRPGQRGAQLNWRSYGVPPPPPGVACPPGTPGSAMGCGPSGPGAHGAPGMAASSGMGGAVGSMMGMRNAHGAGNRAGGCGSNALGANPQAAPMPMQMRCGHYGQQQRPYAPSQPGHIHQSSMHQGSQSLLPQGQQPPAQQGQLVPGHGQPGMPVRPPFNGTPSGGNGSVVMRPAMPCAVPTLSGYNSTTGTVPPMQQILAQQLFQHRMSRLLNAQGCAGSAPQPSSGCLTAGSVAPPGGCCGQHLATAAPHFRHGGGTVAAVVNSISCHPPYTPTCKPSADGDDTRDQLRASIRKLEASMSADAAAAQAGAPGERNAAHASGGRQARGAGGQGADSSTLFIRKLPAQLCAVDSLTSHFSRFGRLINVKVFDRTRNALVEFSSHAEARAAFDSQEPVLGDPGVLISWAKGSSRGGPSAQADAQRTSGRGDSEETPAGGPRKAIAAVAARPAARPPPQSARASALLQLQKQKQTLLQKQLAEQKTLLAKLETMKGLPKADRAEILKQLNRLSESVKELLKSHPAATKRAAEADARPRKSAKTAGGAAEAQPGAEQSAEPAQTSEDQGEQTLQRSAEAEAGAKAEAAAVEAGNASGLKAASGDALAAAVADGPVADTAAAEEIAAEMLAAGEAAAEDVAAEVAAAEVAAAETVAAETVAAENFAAETFAAEGAETFAADAAPANAEETGAPARSDTAEDAADPAPVEEGQAHDRQAESDALGDDDIPETGADASMYTDNELTTFDEDKSV